ncbi:MAG: BrnT family toxin, partial [Cyanobacteria bacterium J06621_15]
VEIAARTVEEQRFLVIGLINQKCWAAIITYREERVRIISVRRARDEEVKIYEG